MADQEFVKIAFELDQDEDGYPPDTTETLWAVPLDQPGTYRVDNIPFYIKGISSDDVIRAEERDGQLQFWHLVTASGNSVFRLCIFDQSLVQSARDRFRALGCPSELYSPRMFAIEVPAAVDFKPIAELMEQGVKDGRWEYEDGVVRHAF